MVSVVVVVNVGGCIYIISLAYQSSDIRQEEEEEEVFINVVS